MVVGAFPIAKLAVLLVKQISKPIANAAKERAKHHPFFRTYVCMPPAQFYNWCEIKAKMWVLNLGKPVNIPVLSQETAIELGANLLGEGLIFVIGSVLLIIEYNRQAKKEAVKEANRLEEWNKLTDTITELYFNVQQQETKLRELERTIQTGGKSTDLPETGGPKSEVPTTPPKQSSGPPGAMLDKKPADKPQSCTEKKPESPQNTVGTPYPNQGFILKSLNYIQMDVFSLPRFFNYSDQMHNESIKKPSQRDTAYLTNILQNIEINFTSLF